MLERQICLECQLISDICDPSDSEQFRRWDPRLLSVLCYCFTANSTFSANNESRDDANQHKSRAQGRDSAAHHTSDASTGRVKRRGEQRREPVTQVMPYSLLYWMEGNHQMGLRVGESKGEEKELQCLEWRIQAVRNARNVSDLITFIAFNAFDAQNI